MADRIVTVGIDAIEQVLVDDSYTETLNTIAVGNGTDSPSSTDTSLTNILYEADTSGTNVSASAASGAGEIKYTIEVTGGTEVPADSSLTEFGVKMSDDTLVYYEVKSAGIDVGSGETKLIEIRVQPSDAGTSTTAITNVGVDLVAEMLLGNSSEKINTIAIGASSQNTAVSDTSMFDEVYRADTSNSNIDIATTTNIGKPQFVITVSAGSEFDDHVSGNTDVSEFGLISSNGTLYLHETRDNIVTLSAGDTKTFNIPLEITQ